MVISQIEALRMKVVGPSGFIQPDLPNPNALQDMLLNSNEDLGANDICIDLGYCTSSSHSSQKEFIVNMIANKHLWEETNTENSIATVVPPSFKPVETASDDGAGEGTKETKKKL
jgi:hypothetical protein